MWMRDRLQTCGVEVELLTLEGAKNCSLEFCFRDIYTIDGDRPRLANDLHRIASL